MARGDIIRKGDLPLKDGTLQQNLNADMIDGYSSEHIVKTTGANVFTADQTIDKYHPKLDFKSDQSGASVAGRLESAEDGTFWLNVQGGKVLWLNWQSPSGTAQADLRVGDGQSGSSILSVIGSTRSVEIDGVLKTGDVYIGGSGNKRLITRHIDGKSGTTQSYDNLYIGYHSGLDTIINAGSGGGNVGIGTTSPSQKLTIDGGNVELVDGEVVLNPQSTATSTTNYWSNIVRMRSSQWDGVNLAPKTISGYIQMDDGGDWHIYSDGSGASKQLIEINRNSDVMMKNLYLGKGGTEGNIYNVNVIEGYNDIVVNPQGNGYKFRLVDAGMTIGGNYNPTATLDIRKNSAVGLRIARTSGQPSIKGNATNGDDGHLIIDSDGRQVWINHYVSDNVHIATGGGNVGIGTSSPNYKLEVNGISRLLDRLDVITNAGNTHFGYGGTTNHVTHRASTGAFYVRRYDGTNHLGADFTVDGGGNIGIGTTSPSYGLHQLGGGQKLQEIANPSTPTISNVGTTGTTSYSYSVVAEDRNGGKTIVSSWGTTTTGNATLDATNYNTISWSSVTGAVKYYVLKGNYSTLLGTTSSTSLNDTGQATSAYSYVDRNSTADMTVDGSGHFGRAYVGTHKYHDGGDGHATFSHVGFEDDSTSYALLQHNTGNTYLNSPTKLYLRTANASRLDITNSLADFNVPVRGNVSGALRVDSGSGTVDIGAKNTSHAHITTDRSNFYFSTEIRVNSGLVGSYDEDLNLRTSATNRLTLSNSGGSATFVADDGTTNRVKIKRNAGATTGGKMVFLELKQDDVSTTSVPTVYPSIRFHHGGRYWVRIEGRSDGFHFKEGHIGGDAYKNITASTIYAKNVVANAESHFSNGTYTDPHSGVSYAIKASGGIATDDLFSKQIGVNTGNRYTGLNIYHNSGTATYTGTGAFGGIHLMQPSNDDYYVGITTSADTSHNTTQGGILFQGSGNYGTKIRFMTTNSYASGMMERMVLDHSGNLGIGTSSPSSKFEINNNGATTTTFYANVGNIGSSQTLFEHTGANTPVPFNLRKSGYSGSSKDYGILQLDMNHDVIGGGSNLHFRLKDSVGNWTEYGGIGASIESNSDGAEKGTLTLYSANRKEVMNIKDNSDTLVGRLANKDGVSTDNTFGLYFDSGYNSGYAIYRESGAWTNPYPDLRIAFHTGIKIGAYHGYGGTKFYNNSDMATELMSIGDGDNNVRINNNAGNTKIGGHLWAGYGNEVWTSSTALYFNYRGSGGNTYFWNLGASGGRSVLHIDANGETVKTVGNTYLATHTGNVAIGQTSPTYGLHQLGGGHKLQSVGNPATPTVTVVGEKGTPAVAEVASLQITAPPSTAGSVTVTLDGVSTTIAVDPAVETTAVAVADKIRGTAFSGWTTGGTAGTDTVTFTANTTGAKTDATYSDGTTGATGTMTTTTQGKSDTRTRYEYSVIAEDRNGNKTLVSGEGFVTDGYPTLDTSNYNTISWTAISGAVKYHILKSNTSTLLGTVTGTSISDTGQATSAFTYSGRNETADMTVDGRLNVSDINGSLGFGTLSGGGGYIDLNAGFYNNDPQWIGSRYVDSSSSRIYINVGDDASTTDYVAITTTVGEAIDVDGDFSNISERIKLYGSGGAYFASTVDFGGAVNVGGRIDLSRHGMSGDYSSSQVQQIWSIDSQYNVDITNNNYGDMYGLGYSHSNAGIGDKTSKLSNEHAINVTNNGTIGIALGMNGNSWHRGNVNANSVNARGHLGVVKSDSRSHLYVTSAGSSQSNGAWVSGTASSDTDIRPQLTMKGYYPELNLVSNHTTNLRHGAVMRFVGYTDGATLANWSHWTMGTPAQDPSFFSIGFATGNPANPHSGLDGYYETGASGFSDVIRLKNNGYVGIGNIDPQSTLHVSGGTKLDGDLTLNPALAGYNIGIKQGLTGGNATMELTTTDTNKSQATRIMMRGNTNDANIEFLTGGRGYESTYVFMDGVNKRLGINTTAPSQALDVSGNINASGSALINAGDTVYGTASLPTLTLGVDGTKAGTIKLFGGTAGSSSLIQHTTSSLHIDSDSGIYLNHYKGSFVRVSSELEMYGDAEFKAGHGRGLRFWQSDSYKIYMSASDDLNWGGSVPWISFGDGTGVDFITDYNTYFRMQSNNRGWAFRNDEAGGINAQIEGNGRIHSKKGFRANNFEMAYNGTEDSLDFIYHG